MNRSEKQYKYKLAIKITDQHDGCGAPEEHVEILGFPTEWDREDMVCELEKFSNAEYLYCEDGEL